MNTQIQIDSVEINNGILTILYYREGDTESIDFHTIETNFWDWMWLYGHNKIQTEYFERGTHKQVEIDLPAKEAFGQMNIKQREQLALEYLITKLN